MTKVEWRKGPDFAEVAEVLGINTDQIMLASLQGKLTIVLYTPDEDGDPPLWRAEVERGVDGVMNLKGAPAEIDLPDDLQDLLGGGV